jgi:hypothetical protein
MNSGDKGYRYDSSVYTITDTVTDVDGQLVLSRVVTNDSNKPVSNYAFINKYSAGFGSLFEDDDSQGSKDPPSGLLPDSDNPFGVGTFMGGAEPEVKSFPDSGVIQTGGDATGGGNGNGRLLTSGGYGPKTGDDRNSALYLILLISGGALSTGASIYLVAGEKKRKEINDTL